MTRDVTGSGGPAPSSHQLSDIERTHGVNICTIGNGESPTEVDEKDGLDDYYAQIPQELRNEARMMSKHYELFYCLELSIRNMVIEILQAERGVSWWETAVPEVVRSRAQANIDRERDSGVTPRSTRNVDYTTFGDLGEITIANWDVFGSTFNSRKALEKILTGLNVLRGPIAHCSPLAEDEVMRLHLTLRDWCRLME